VAPGPEACWRNSLITFALMTSTRLNRYLNPNAPRTDFFPCTGTRTSGSRRREPPFTKERALAFFRLRRPESVDCPVTSCARWLLTVPRRIFIPRSLARISASVLLVGDTSPAGWTQMPAALLPNKGDFGLVDYLASGASRSWKSRSPSRPARPAPRPSGRRRRRHGGTLVLRLSACRASSEDESSQARSQPDWGLPKPR
jgi:hypothetical protein